METTDAASSQVVQLVNDTSYDFYVVAVDDAGNVARVPPRPPPSRPTVAAGP